MTGVQKLLPVHLCVPVSDDTVHGGLTVVGLQVLGTRQMEVLTII